MCRLSRPVGRTGPASHSGSGSRRSRDRRATKGGRGDGADGQIVAHVAPPELQTLAAMTVSAVILHFHREQVLPITLGAPGGAAGRRDDRRRQRIEGRVARDRRAVRVACRCSSPARISASPDETSPSPRRAASSCSCSTTTPIPWRVRWSVALEAFAVDPDSPSSAGSCATWTRRAGEDRRQASAASTGSCGPAVTARHPRRLSDVLLSRGCVLRPPRRYLEVGGYFEPFFLACTEVEITRDSSGTGGTCGTCRRCRSTIGESGSPTIR